jgi:hypothetical protein
VSVPVRSAEVAAGYVHVTKLIRPAPPIELGDAVLKWYDIAPAVAPVPEEIRGLARAALAAASSRGDLAVPGELGFVILHRCGTAFYFLLVSTWRNDNNLWETVWAKAGEEDPDFRPWPVAGRDRPTFSMWELGAVCHEQQAWGVYLRSRRDAAARQAYLDSCYEGEV